MPTNISIGQQLGNYQLVQLIGKGGFADVYLGNHVLLNTQAAIKVLDAHLIQADVQHFFAEARTMANLFHPNIVRILDFGIEPKSNVPFLVMDYAPGGPLRQNYPRGTKLSFPTVISYSKQIASALQYVHGHHLIHRDVKPENMLLGRNNEVLLSDFGIASATRNFNKVVFGTADYMAPEQQASGSCPASDQYALGIVVYEWLCGTVPFTGASSREIADKHAHTSPPSLRSKDPAIPLSLEMVVLKALEKDPARRHSSIQVFVDEVERALQAGKNVATPPTLTLVSPINPPTTPTMPMANTPGSPGMAAPTIRQPVSSPSQGSTVPISAPPTLPQQVSVPTTVRFSQPAKGQLGDTLFVYTGHNDFFVNSVAWSPDSSRIASGGDDQAVHLWDAFTGRKFLEFCAHRDQIEAVAWSPDGARIVSGCASQVAHVWQADTGTLLTTYKAHAGHSTGIGFSFTVAWSPDGSVIASGSSDRTIHFWDAQSGDNQGICQGHTTEVNAVTWSPDGQYIASASDDKHVRVWNRATQQTSAFYDRHTKRVRAVAWSPDGTRIASASDDATVIVWIDTGQGNAQIQLVYTGHAKRVRAVAWSPDGTRIASASDDRTIRIWNATTGGLIRVYRGHTGDINALAWSPNGAYIASASNDATVHIWQAE